jgi:hypothetical protein
MRGVFSPLRVATGRSEAVLLVVAAILWLFYRDRLTDWQRAATPRSVNQSANPSY